MSDKTTKFLRQLSAKERAVIDSVVARIVVGDLVGLDVKKMAGEEDLFRVRKGKIRIIFDGKGNIQAIGFRGNIYKK